MAIDRSIAITTEPIEVIKSFLEDGYYSRIMVIVDNNTLEHCYPLVNAGLPAHETITIPPGESFKTLETCTIIWGHMTSVNLDRKSLIINLGGGVIGDMGGFCAATYKRGIDFINLPTTLLAQVDASVGGKLGIDFEGYKNHIGLFRNPEKVIIYPEFLKTLPKSELRSGFAEVIKHCLIADADYWGELIKGSWNDQSWQAIVKHSVGVKSRVTNQDPEEKGLRKILNFGHTIGHAVESFFLETEKPLLHGEAIALGMIAEAYLSVKKSGLTAPQLEQIINYVCGIYEKIKLPDPALSKISQLTIQDKKNEKGKINASLLEKIGTATFDISISENDIQEALEFYQNVKPVSFS